MSLSSLFKQKADTTLATEVDQACADINRALSDDIDILTHRLTAPASRRATDDTVGDYNETTGLLRYKVREFQSIHSENYDTRSADTERIIKMLNDALRTNPAYASLHARCADPATDLRIEYVIEKDFEANVPHTSYNRITAFIELHMREPYAKSTHKLQLPPPPAPVPPPKDAATIAREYLDGLSAQDRAAFLGEDAADSAPAARVLRPVRVKIDKRQG